MEKPKITPKDFFLYVWLMATLYWSSIALLNLLFETINSAFPDKLAYYIDPYSTSLRWAIASLIIIFPAYLITSWYINRDTKAHPEKSELGIRKWLIYLTLFISGLTILIDLIVLLNTFLGGEITTRFGLKVLAVLIVAGGVFGFYLFDLRRDRGVQTSVPKLFGIISILVVILSIVFGFVIMGSPSTARERRFDEQRVNDLMSIQDRVITYWQGKEKIPDSSLSVLEDSISGYKVPTDPENNSAYVYTKTGDKSFKLCATFGLPSINNGNRTIGAYPAEVPVSSAPYYNGKTPDNWSHDKGYVCFDKTIDPQFYPVNKSAIIK
ncbi:MAG: DUF5671 domain-containing protein [Candidatus Paceibacterota bacterium]|jgi:hypothetical protein